MNALTDIFTAEAKVVISPDEMRAWVMLPPPKKGAPYTVDATTSWLMANRVVHGISPKLIRAAIDSERYHELLEVARGETPQNAVGGNYELKIEKKPFTGLKGAPDGSLYYDDLTFLQEVQAGQVLAEVIPPDPGMPGMSVTGEIVQQKAAENSKVLEGSGFEISADGRYYSAPALSHVNIVNEQLIVTPLLKLEQLSDTDRPIDFDGNVLVEKDVMNGAAITATGSVFVQGRTGTVSIKAGRNILLSNGMRASNGFGTLEAADNIWGMCFESAELKAGGDICANHMIGCDAFAGGRAAILGGRGEVANTHLYARGGIVADKFAIQGGKTILATGMDGELIGRFENIDRKIFKLGNDIQTLQQNITTYERINRMKPDKGRNDTSYKDMVKKRDSSLSVLSILNTERTRLKRTMDSYSAASIIARDGVAPGVTIIIDTRQLEVKTTLHRAKFRRSQEEIEVVSSAQTR